MKFNKSQLEAINHGTGPCCVIAGAGSGKTAVLTERIVRLISEGTPSEKILAVTFTKKATAEMKARLYKQIGFNSVSFTTFHKLGYSVLRKASTWLEDRTAIKAYEQIKVISGLMKGTILDEQRASPKHVLSFIENCKHQLRQPRELLPGETVTPELEKLHFIYSEYEAMKEYNGLYDFSDMEDKPVYALRGNFAVLVSIKKEHDYILVDEYQDTSYAQDMLIRLIQPKNENVFVVGDDYQSIYSFRGANVKNMLNFTENFPGAKQIYLDTNYRSTPQIVAISNALIAQNKYQLKKETVSHQLENGPLPSFTTYENEEVEAKSIVNHIKHDLRYPKELSSTAILYRVNRKSRAFEKALFEADVPYKIQDGVPFFMQPHISPILSYLRLSIDPYRFNALENVLNIPNRFLGNDYKKSITKLYNKDGQLSVFDLLKNCPLTSENRYKKNVTLFIDDLRNLGRLSNQGPSVLIDFIYHDMDYLEYLRTNLSHELYTEQIESVKELKYLSIGFSKIVDFLDYAEMQVRAYAKNKNNTNALLLSTVHGVKGLQFNTVYLPSCNHNMFPHENSENYEEERRLLYVGMTRAKTNLHVSSILEDNALPCYVSPYIKDIVPYFAVQSLVF